MKVFMSTKSKPGKARSWPSAVSTGPWLRHKMGGE
jgi:hypothetical protein